MRKVWFFFWKTKRFSFLEKSFCFNTNPKPKIGLWLQSDTKDQLILKQNCWAAESPHNKRMNSRSSRRNSADDNALFPTQELIGFFYPQGSWGWFGSLEPLGSPWSLWYPREPSGIYGYPRLWVRDLKCNQMVCSQCYISFFCCWIQWTSYEILNRKIFHWLLSIWWRN